jgi:hypothetical protein
MKKNIAKFFKVSWNDVRQQVKNVNPDLFEIIDNVGHKKDYSLYKASYPFGTNTVVNGKFYLPNKDGVLVPLSHSSIDKKTQEDLSYNAGTNPVCLVLKNSLEIYLAQKNHPILSLTGMIPPGKIFSTWRVLSPGGPSEPAFLWSVSAGTRSFFMLPKISIQSKHEKLKREYKIKSDAPRNIADHGETFIELAQSENFNQDWTVEMLFFGGKWFEKVGISNLNDTFHNYLYRLAWESSEYWRIQFIWDIVFSLIQKSINLARPNPYIIDTIKHLIGIGVGTYPAFAPAIDDSAAPISKLQDIYREVYKLEEYAPIIMQPLFHSVYDTETRPVYYSLEYPTTFESSPRSKQHSNKIVDLKDLKHLMEKYLTSIIKGKFNVEQTRVFDMAKSIKFDYFHTEVHRYQNLNLSTLLPEQDETFMVNQKHGSVFPYNSPFLRGCIRIAKK